MNDSEHDPIAELVRLAGRRHGVDPERAARVRTAVANEWRKSVIPSREDGRGTPSRGAQVEPSAGDPSTGLRFAAAARDDTGAGSARRWRLAVAAAIAAAIAGLLLLRPRTVPTAPPLRPPVVATTGATKSIDWSGGSLRLDRDTQLRIDTARTATLLRGAIYYANETPGVAVTIHTPFGDVRDVGTRFELRLRSDAVRIRVRDGAVIVRDTTARAGTELVAGRTTVTTRSIATSGDDWAWVENAAPPIVLEGKSLDQVLRRVAIEKGLTLERSGPDQTLHGDVPLSVNEALDAATAAAGVTYRIEGGRLIVRGRS